MTEALALYKRISDFSEWSESELVTFLRLCDDAYYNDGLSLSPKVRSLYNTISDEIYDKAFDTLRALNPKNKYLSKIGAPAVASHASQRMTTLPFPMASLDKLKPESADKWLEGKRYIIVSNKMDGMSAGLISNGHGNIKLFSRGNGSTGQDVSYLVDYIPCLRQLRKVKIQYRVRGELILPKSVFVQNQYGNKFATPRNMMCGLLNNSKISHAIKNVHFVAYSLIYPEMVPSEAFAFLDEYFETPGWKRMTLPSAKKLSSLLSTRKQKVDYDIDGLVLTEDVYESPDNSNPKHSKAYKDNSLADSAIAIVTNIEWQVSKYGTLNPVVCIEDRITHKPVKLVGVNISKASGFNAKFICDNNIGKGAIVEIVRSNDVIPYIKNIIKGTQPDLPKEEFVWNKSHVDIFLVHDSSEVKIKKISNFFRILGARDISTGTFARMYHNGFTTINSILEAKEKDLLQIDGFRQASVDTILKEIRSIKDVPLSSLMYASVIFDRNLGKRRLQAVIDEYPDILSWENTKANVKKLLAIDGYSQILAESFLSGLPKFKIFLSKLSPKITYSVQQTQSESDILKGQTIVLTGFRDSAITTFIEQNGGKAGSSISSKTTLLLVKDIQHSSSKTNKAKELGIPIISKDDFIQKYVGEKYED